MQNNNESSIYSSCKMPLHSIINKTTPEPSKSDLENKINLSKKVLKVKNSSSCYNVCILFPN